MIHSANGQINGQEVRNASPYNAVHLFGCKLTNSRRCLLTAWKSAGRLVGMQWMKQFEGASTLVWKSGIGNTHPALEYTIDMSCLLVETPETPETQEN